MKLAVMRCASLIGHHVPRIIFHLGLNPSHLPRSLTDRKRSQDLFIDRDDALLATNRISKRLVFNLALIGKSRALDSYSILICIRRLDRARWEGTITALLGLDPNLGLLGNFRLRRLTLL